MIINLTLEINIPDKGLNVNVLSLVVGKSRMNPFYKKLDRESFQPVKEPD